MDPAESGIPVPLLARNAACAWCVVTTNDLGRNETRSLAKGWVSRIAQVKLPVSDLAASVRWYEQLLDLRVWVEIAEDGIVRGAGLIDAQGRFNIALRDREVCADHPRLRGFDVVGFEPASRQALDELVARCDRFGIDNSGVVDVGVGHVLDIPDPDGTVLRFYHFTASTEGFTGVQMVDGRQVGTYDTPRLVHV